MEALLLLAVFFLGTNFVAVKYAVVGVPRCPSWPSGSRWQAFYSWGCCAS